jgi:predicted CXXCH cytochrome family protein
MWPTPSTSACKSFNASTPVNDARLISPSKPRPGRTGAFALACLAIALTGARADPLISSVHNLSVTGPGSIKASGVSNPCIFCHTVHKANGETPLWNHTMSSVNNYVVYSSSRLQSLGITVPQPNGSSRLCLSCHDGTIALGSISSSVTPVTVTQNGTAITTLPAGSSNLGTDLSADHPVSVDYDAAALADNTLLPRSLVAPAIQFEPLNGAFYLQCTSCHDPHDNRYGKFLVMENTNSALCATCHQPSQWMASAHATAATPAPQAAMARAATRSAPGKAVSRPAMTPVSALGCANCHANHGAPDRHHLLAAPDPEQSCFGCHDAASGKKNVAADFQKLSTHPVGLARDAHSSAEDPVNPKQRHVTCADCHDPHAARTVPAVAPNASGALANLTGVTAAGGTIKPLQREYELCFRCHGDSLARGPAKVARQFPETNTRLQFSAANQSFHPVEQVGRNLNSVPSLIPPWTVNSIMYCTDCHNSDSGPKAGGSGANGPHGSMFAPLLERNLTFNDFEPESPAAYALCYKCHDRNRVLSNSSFRLHYSHVVGDKAACTTCHDSHGTPAAMHLINFNSVYVTNSSLGTIQYDSTGPLQGVCTLTCHGQDHKHTSY